MKTEKRGNRLLVLDGEQRAALAVVRSLGSKGITVFVGSHLASSLSGCSRFCRKKVRYSDPLSDYRKFCYDLRCIIRDEQISSLLPMTDLTMNAVLKEQHGFNGVTILCESAEKYRKASDKILLEQLARELGIPVPPSHIISHRDELTPPYSDLCFPAVLKPRASILWENGKMVKTRVRVVSDPLEFSHVLSTDNGFRQPFLVQKKISGEGTGLFALCLNGEALAVFSHRRIREKPPWGGVSVLCESIPPDPLAMAYALKLLKTLEWNGVAMVEFKRDEKSSIPYLMEINARFWGSLQLAIDAGVDFPFLLYQHSQGVPIQKITSFKKTRLRWLLGDIDSCYLTLKNAFTNDPLSIWRKVLMEFLKDFFSGAKLQNLRLNDMRPFLCEVRAYLGDFLRF